MRHEESFGEFLVPSECVVIERIEILLKKRLTKLSHAKERRALLRFKQ